MATWRRRLISVRGARSSGGHCGPAFASLISRAAAVCRRWIILANNAGQVIFDWLCRQFGPRQATFISICARRGRPVGTAPEPTGQLATAAPSAAVHSGEQLCPVSADNRAQRHSFGNKQRRLLCRFVSRCAAKRSSVPQHCGTAAQRSPNWAKQKISAVTRASGGGLIAGCLLRNDCELPPAWPAQIIACLEFRRPAANWPPPPPPLHPASRPAGFQLSKARAGPRRHALKAPACCLVSKLVSQTSPRWRQTIERAQIEA